MKAGESGQAPAGVVNRDGAGPWVLVCEHASNHIPAPYGNLGLSNALLTSHIAWDPGAMAVAEALSRMLSAPLVAQKVSRLLYDCNRPPEAPSAVPARSEIHEIPGNNWLSDAQREERAERFYFPFRDMLSAVIDRQAALARPPAIVTVHSFTPVYFGRQREVEIGILHDADSRLADAVLAAAEGSGLIVRRNEPYGPQDGVTHTLATHAIPRGLPNVMIEIRNDLITTAEEQLRMAERLAEWLSAALPTLDADERSEHLA